jgi:pimeloyl-ACP methyl ester carboxylesterase
MKTYGSPYIFAALLLGGCVAFHAGPLPGEPAGAAFATVDGVRLRYTDAGAGPPVVLVHGFASSLDAWAAVAPELAKTHRVISLDLMGFGWSARPERDYAPAAEAALVLGLLDQLHVERAAFVAHSWGSAVVLALALAAPERVARLALYDAWAYEEQLPTTFLWARAPGVGEALFGAFYAERADEKMALAFYDRSYVTEDFVERVEAQLARPGTTAAALAAARGQRLAAQAARYREIAQPALILWGREDCVSTLAFGERLSRELPHARLVAYPRCGHFPMIEAQGASTAELVAFLAEAR